MDSLRVLSPAKVNLRLDVLYERDDGYHELRTIMQRIDLCDELEVSVGGEEIDVSSQGEDIPQGTGNMAYHAARSILEKFRIDIGVRIFIRKKIPVASGLGGGSSNAAATLMALNRLLELGLTRRGLMRMGTRLGADVPFFVYGGSALAGGIGDRLEAIELPSPIWMVLVNPGIKVSTAWAYKNLNTGLTKKINNISILPPMAGISDVANFLYNDLEIVTIERYPEIQKIKNGLIDRGALGALMSGSGPTVFGIFPDKEVAERAFHQLKLASPEYTLFLSSSLDNEDQGGVNGSNGS